MKRQVLLVIGCCVLGFLGVGCGPSVEEEPAPRSEEQAPEESPSGESSDGEVEALARLCIVECRAVKVPTEEACAPFTGRGSTTFLGGCKKACRFAWQDIEGQAAQAGCRLTTCDQNCR
jgi:hypothetical protein